jgi:hypothetical protein
MLIKQRVDEINKNYGMSRNNYVTQDILVALAFFVSMYKETDQDDQHEPFHNSG